MGRYRARAEFRREDRASPWVIAGISIAGRFRPVHDGVEPIRGRLPEPGLVAWRDLPEPIIAPDPDRAAHVALEVARGRWPDLDRDPVPWASGGAEQK